MRARVLVRPFGGLVVGLAIVAGCGARTPLLVDDGTAETFDASAPSDGRSNVDSDGGGSDAKDAAPVVVIGPVCTSDADCADALSCTTEKCDPVSRHCLITLHDDVCDDHVFCDGEETCDPKSGCRSAPAMTCDDGVTCTHDRCDEAGKQCVNMPDDALCPLSHGCNPPLGCQARALAQSSTDLYEIKLPSGAVRLIGPTGRDLADIALHPDKTLYGADVTDLWSLDTNTGHASFVAGTPVSFNALDVSPAGTLYGGAGAMLYTIDRTSGTPTPFATYPNGLQSSGDLAFFGGRLLATARIPNGGNDYLVEVDLMTRQTTVLGQTGYDCIWGLAAFGTTLYGLTCEGRVLTIDTTNGKSTQVATSQVQFFGASAR